MTGMENALSSVREGLAPIGALLRRERMARTHWAGGLVRPLAGWAAAGSPTPVERDPLWRALGAVQLAHEASLLHDDVIDGAGERRGRTTVVAERGVAAALVEGDHLLTSAYRLAAATGSLAWAELFADAVERTVAGEKTQAATAGRALTWAEYHSLVLGKSGELLGAAVAAGAVLAGGQGVGEHRALGRRLGLIYQMLDDLLDYCPHVDTGKPSLQDYRRGLWTWPQLYVDLPAGLPMDEVVRRLRTPERSGLTPLHRCLHRLRLEADAVKADASRLFPDDGLMAALLSGWVARATEAVPRLEDDPPPADTVLPTVEGWRALMAEHARSFRFASRLFPARQREQVTGVYAWCRYTDDLVDGVDLPAAELEARLDVWLELSRRAYEGAATGNELADRVMRDMAAADVPFGYAAELVEGMRMDVRGARYDTLDDLSTYTYRVASVVGLWVTELFGIRDPWMLDRATTLGRAMQLTNILRDVGEDLDQGRLYLPAELLREHDLNMDDLREMRANRRIRPRYAELVERLLQHADAQYDFAIPAIHRLPDFYRRPVAVAAEVYRGIHQAIRANDYDNLTRRAHTTLPTKLKLGTGALLRPRQHEPESPETQPVTRAAILGLSALLVMSAPCTAQGPGALQDTAPSAMAPGAAAGAVPIAAPSPMAPGAAPIAAPSPAPPATAQAAAPGRVAGQDTNPALEEIGRLWVTAVDSEAAVDSGLVAIREVRAASSPAPREDRLLTAYEGSFIALRAKHGGWPHQRLGNLRSGFELMDRVVAEAPDAPELRYVRLMSGFYLPGILGRGEGVEEDLAALVRLVPEVPEAFPATLLPEVVRFLLENADPTPAERGRLEALLP